MKYKKLFIIIIYIICFLFSNNLVYASDSGDSQWVKDSFDATQSFLKEDFNKVDILKLDSWFVPLVSVPLKIINRVLIVTLFGLSAVALAYCGIQFILGADTPRKKTDARENIRTVFIGMGYGFGAYVIWFIAMQIVSMILGFVAT